MHSHTHSLKHTRAHTRKHMHARTNTPCAQGNTSSGTQGKDAPPRDQQGQLNYPPSHSPLELNSPAIGSPLIYSQQVPTLMPKDMASHSVPEFLGAPGWPATPKLMPVVIICKLKDAQLHKCLRTSSHTLAHIDVHIRKYTLTETHTHVRTRTSAHTLTFTQIYTHKYAIMLSRTCTKCMPASLSLSHSLSLSLSLLLYLQCTTSCF